MKPQYSIIGLLFLSISSIAVAQQDLVAAVVGNVTGTVEDKDGNLVPPQTAGEAPSIPLNFTPTGGTAWTTTLSGQASSPTGLRAYILAFDFEILETAIFSGNALPSDRTYSGNLASTQTVVVPLSIPAFGVNETLSFVLNFTGTW